MKDLRQTKEYAKYMKLLGWSVETIQKNISVYIKKLPIIGSVIKIQRFSGIIPMEIIEKFRKKYRAFNILIEPNTEKLAQYYLDNKFSISSPSLASKTVILDITKSEKTLMANLHYKTRYNIKLSGKKGLQVRVSSDIEKFARFWEKTARQRGMFLPLKNEIKSIYSAFGKKAKIYDAVLDNEVVAELLTVSSETTVYYMYAGSNMRGKRFFAPTLLVWRAILASKKAGYKYFDFEGIYDERFPLKSWKGFSRFKKSFGGHKVSYPGTLSRFYFPWSFT